jgi:hypothetical protein
MTSVPSMCKTSGRYHGIFLSTEPGSDATPLAHDTAGLVGMAGGSNQMHKSIHLLDKRL